MEMLLKNIVWHFVVLLSRLKNLKKYFLISSETVGKHSIYVFALDMKYLTTEVGN
jgi:hypothetical protein